MDIVLAKVTDGLTYCYLQDIKIVGRIDNKGDLLVYGCEDADREKFYKGLLDMDKQTTIHGWETVEEVEEFWMDGGDGFMLFVEKGCFEILDYPKVEPVKGKCRICGCTDDNACQGGCYWVEPDLCSKCAL